MWFSHRKDVKWRLLHDISLMSEHSKSSFNADGAAAIDLKSFGSCG